MSEKTILDILFPRRCPVCGEITKPAGSLICPSCFRKLSFVKPPVCKKCGKEVQDETMEYCEDCARHSHAFEYGIALLNYDETAKHSVAQVKYNNKREYLDFYGTALSVRFERKIRGMNVDLLVPVPVHRTRRRKRGFNQAEVLAEVMGRRLKIPVEPAALIRHRKTLPQKELTAAERLKNLSGAVRADRKLTAGKRILLVDDIYTTGSTVEACSRALLEAGAEKVFFAVICMTGGR